MRHQPLGMQQRALTPWPPGPRAWPWSPARPSPPGHPGWWPRPAHPSSGPGGYTAAYNRRFHSSQTEKALKLTCITFEIASSSADLSVHAPYTTSQLLPMLGRLLTAGRRMSRPTTWHLIYPLNLPLELVRLRTLLKNYVLSHIICPFVV